jgi:hypothetical protein
MTTTISNSDFDAGKVAMIGHLLIRDMSTGEVLLNQRDQSNSRKAFQSDDEQSQQPE